MNIADLRAIAVEWREEAERYRRRGQEHLALFEESLACDLEERLNAWYFEKLTLHEAAEESGVAYSTIQQKVASGELPNAAEKGSPRIQRCHLPSRGGGSPPLTGEPDIAAKILSVS